MGYLNLLVCNAGVMGPTFGPGVSVQQGPDKSSLADLQRDLFNVDPAALTDLFRINVGGVFFSIAAFLPLLDAGNNNNNNNNSNNSRSQGGNVVAQKSQVVVTSSIGGFNRVPAAHYAYSASKAAVTHMAKQFATTFAGYGIRFNVIAPGCEFVDPLFFPPPPSII